MNKLFLFLITVLLLSCGDKKVQTFTTDFNGSEGEVKLITLDPGHFHAALVQKTSYPQISSEVFVYSPGGNDLKEHLAKIEAYNTRMDDPTHWKEIVYEGPDFLDKMLEEKKGNVMVTAGNNRLKTDYIKKTLQAGINVLADKPMVITPELFDSLKECFDIAQKNGVLLYDIMTERYEITSILQRELSLITSIFGEQEKGTPQHPAVEMESVHNFYKVVSGKVLTRPAWFYDVDQQGEGLVDVSTHLVDLVQWELFPNVALDYTKDVTMHSSRRWPTLMTKEQFKASTGMEEYPDYLLKDVLNDTLQVYQNGEILYQLKGVNVKLTILWNYESPKGGDSHYSMLRGTKATLTIRQGEKENYRPELYLTPSSIAQKDIKAYEKDLTTEFSRLAQKYPGVRLEPVVSEPKTYHIVIPDSYRNGHEAHFGQVTQNFLKYLQDGKLPDWEVPCMLTKYYVTTQALKMAR